MHKELNATFAEECFATVEYFQLKSIDLPDAYEKAIQETEVKKQDIIKAQAEKDKVAIELETKVKQAEIASQIQVNQAQGEADASVVENVATAKAFYDVQTQQATSLAGVKQSLGLTNQQVNQYMKTKLLKEYPESKMLIGID